MFDIMFNWVAKIKTKRQLLKLYYMLLDKRLELVGSSSDRYSKYYYETKNVSDAVAYILYTKFNCHNYNITRHYEHIDTDVIQEYIDNLNIEQERVESTESSYHTWWDVDDSEMDYIY